MMRVMMLSTMAGPLASARPGDIIEIEERVGLALVAGRFAVPLDRPAAREPIALTPVKTEPERAVAGPYERAVADFEEKTPGAAPSASAGHHRYGRSMTAADYPIGAVSGIGAKRQRQLTALGVVTVADLLSIDAERLAENIEGVGLRTVRRWKKRARSIVNGEL